MANRSNSKNPNPQNEQNGNSEMNDPVQPGSSSSDIDERMSTQLALNRSAHTSVPLSFPYLLTTSPARDYEKAIDETNVISEDRLRRAIPQSSTSYHEPTEDTFDISWRPDPSGHPRRTF
ncbi:hypothetical protein PENNAL_c0024G06958 [Penicillium nalgiovense]|uniref:Uncharacterized protein n=1 Tax=Penicillium nalgiovense TaxID=60175 RepID=A0A1V6YD78_PENNA|nr:hypothetical protein PENNAL_c0024G06958 [Penicillium nalgiovense]